MYLLLIIKRYVTKIGYVLEKYTALAMALLSIS